MQVKLLKAVLMAAVLAPFAIVADGCSCKEPSHAVAPPEGTPKLKVPAFVRERRNKP